jgi:ubiquinol-cytochrome c reductase cytochrome b subunit
MSTLLGWFDQRTGWSGPIRTIFRYPVPAHAHHNPLFTMGSLLLVLFVVQAFTGSLMAFYYDPSPEGAYASVDYMQFILPFGWLVRGVHHWAASAMVIIVVLHLLRTYLYSAYKKPRELTWLVGVVLLLITVSFGFTGYLLPWDQKGYWATQVGTEIAGSVPAIGSGLRDLMRGGADMGIATLTRFYSVHMLLLPGAFVVLVLAHLALMRRHGLAPALVRKGHGPEKTVPFYPTHLAIEAGVALVVIAGLVVAANLVPAPLDLRADPTDTSFVPRPDWYFLFYFQLLTYFPGGLEAIGTVAIPLFFFGSLVVLPFIDRGAERRPWRKPVTSVAFVLYAVAVILLTIRGAGG